MDLDTLIQQLVSLREEDPDEVDTLDRIGCALALASRWDGVTLMQVLSAGLTDANFHRDAAMVDRMIAAYLPEGDED